MQIILKEEIKMLLNLVRVLEKDIKSLEKKTESMIIDGVGKITLPVLLGEIITVR